MPTETPAEVGEAPNWVWIVAVVLTAPFLIYFKIERHEGWRAIAAAISVGAIVMNAFVFFAYRNKPIYWLALLSMLLLHIAMLALVSPTDLKGPYFFIIMPPMTADFFLWFLILRRFMPVKFKD